MKKFIISLLLIGSLFSGVAKADDICHDVRLTTDYLKTYGFQQKWVGSIPGTHSSIFVFQDNEGHWSLYMVTLDRPSETPIMCQIISGDKGLVTQK